MNYHLPNFNVKNLVKEAGTTLSRVVQVNIGGGGGRGREFIYFFFTY